MQAAAVPRAAVVHAARAQWRQRWLSSTPTPLGASPGRPQRRRGATQPTGHRAGRRARVGDGKQPKQPKQPCWKCGSVSHRAAFCQAPFEASALLNGDTGTATQRPHTPVLRDGVLTHLNVRLNNGTASSPALVLDCTFGAGGHTGALLQRHRATGVGVRVIASDCDPLAFQYATECSEEAGGTGVLQPLLARFSGLDAALAALLVEPCSLDGIIADLGVSSMQLDDGSRGFSFQHDGPIDMRMGEHGDEAVPGAADILATISEPELADVIHRLGEEEADMAAAVARQIIKQRDAQALWSTKQLASAVVQAFRKRGVVKRQARHVATKTFMALRMLVNRELDELDALIAVAAKYLRPSARMSVITFHRLELQRVVAGVDATPELRVVHRSRPTDQEIKGNPRARSATLLGVERLREGPNV